jgi:D-alanyl-D-alanine carboxypeptidase
MKLRPVHVFFASCLACAGARPAPLAVPPSPCLAPPHASSVPAPNAAGAGVASAEASAPALPSTFDVTAIDAYIEGQVATQGFVGLSVAIVKDGVIVLEKGYGYRELPHAPVEADTPFLIASITKQFVSALVLQLADEKKLSVDDKVAKYFPDLTRAKDITLYDLMTHVSGYRDEYPLDFVDQEMQHPTAPDDIIARYGKRPLDFEPRTRFSYSSTGYKILGRVVEKVTGKTLGAALEERILRPTGMTHSSYLPVGTSGLAKGYTNFALGPPELAEPEAEGWLFGSSGLYASAGDLAKWDIALMNGKVLGPESYKIFSTPRRLADGRWTTYGCGIVSRVNGDGETVLRHSGADSGFVSYGAMVPGSKSAVVALSNRDGTSPRDLASKLLALLDQEHRPPPLKMTGLSAKIVAAEMFAMMQSGRVDRSRLGDDFNAFLTDTKLTEAGARLRPFGELIKIEVDQRDRKGWDGTDDCAPRFRHGEARGGSVSECRRQGATVLDPQAVAKDFGRCPRVQGGNRHRARLGRGDGVSSRGPRPRQSTEAHRGGRSTPGHTQAFAEAALGGSALFPLQAARGSASVRGPRLRRVAGNREAMVAEVVADRDGARRRQRRLCGHCKSERGTRLLSKARIFPLGHVSHQDSGADRGLLWTRGSQPHTPRLPARREDVRGLVHH